MAALARVDLERLLQARKLGTAVVPSPGSGILDVRAVATTGVPDLDRELGGGWPRGQVSELVGPLSMGASWVACASLAAATRRGELGALIDPLDVFDPETASSAGFVWPYLLWVRGDGRQPPAAGRRQPERATSGEPRNVEPRAPSPKSPAPRRAMSDERRIVEPRAPSPESRVWHQAIDRALKALALVLQTEGFGVVVLDVHEVPSWAVNQLPFTTWRRVQRMLEGRDTACIVMHGGSLARSAGGVTLALSPLADDPRASWRGCSLRRQRLAGLTTHARVIRAEWQGTALSGFTWETGKQPGT